ncbi:ribonuclease H-like domain-containing protein [Xylariaceae sp. FL0255]|nr:ribonuclease H-like domain-containing protein [Xylariaceae sp. FL0255]
MPRQRNKGKGKVARREDEAIEREDETVRREGHYPKHGPHNAGATGHFSPSRFPGPDYTDSVGGATILFGKDKEIAVEVDAFCGTSDLEVNGNYGYQHVRCQWASREPCRCGRHSLHIDSLVIAVDGACPGNGTDRAVKSACGVYFGRDAPENLAFRVPDNPEYPHTSQRAELHAAIAAVKASLPFIKMGGQWDCENCPKPCTVRHVVIKSDSAYLVNNITGPVRKWFINGWRTAKNTEVKNKDLWEELFVFAYGYQEELGVTVDFWHVRREHNVEADRLANEGLHRHLPLGLPTFE